MSTQSTCTHHTDSERIACPVCLVTSLRAELAVAQKWVQHKSHHADDLIAENVELRAERDYLRAELERLTTQPTHADLAWYVRELAQTNEHKDDWMSKHYAIQSECVKLRAELATERARMKKIETALKDAISTYFGADKLVTAERIEAWQFAMKEEPK